SGPTSSANSAGARRRNVVSRSVPGRGQPGDPSSPVRRMRKERIPMKRHLPYLLLALAVLGTPAAFASTLTVTNLKDDGSAGSLRQVIASAASGDTIKFAVTGTIKLTSGQLTINKNLTIQGPGATLLTISGNTASRVFLIQFGSSVTLDSLTIAQGNAGSEFGGGILNSGVLTV